MTIIITDASSSRTSFEHRQCKAGRVGSQNCFTHTHDWTTEEIQGFANGTSGITVLKNGTNAPGWREKIGKEIVPYTERHVRSYRWSSSPSLVDTAYCYLGNSPRRATHHSGVGCNIYSVVISDPPALPPINMDSLLQAAWAEVNTKGYQVLVDLAERKETLELFTKFRDRYTKRARELFKKTAYYFKGGRPRKCSREKIADFTRTFQDIWMEKRYGWDQLVYSSDDILDALRHWDTTHPVFVTGITGKDEEVASLPGTSGVSVDRPFGMGYDFYVSTRKTKIKARAKVVALVRESHKSIAGLSFNPMATVWEIIPYSFVVDWITNMGEIFAAHWPSAAFAGSTASVSTKWTDEVNYEVDIRPTLADHPRRSGINAKFSFTNEEYQRTPRLDVPLVLEYRPEITWKRVLDATALVRRFVPRSVERWARCQFT